jgi:hypothetical protein
LLRKQLALYQERKVKPRRATTATRIAIVWLSRWFDWRQALAVVQPKTFIRWHRLSEWSGRLILCICCNLAAHHGFRVLDRLSNTYIS